MLNIVIPMAGRGSQFSSAGYIDPKPLIPLNDKRMIEVVVNNLTPTQPHRFIFICQQEHLDHYNYEAELKKIATDCIVIGINGVTEGAACTVMVAEKYINNDQALMIANADQWVDIDIDDYLDVMANDDLDALIMTMKADDAKWSFVELDEQGMVTNVVEKVVVSDEATVGIYNYKHGRYFCRCAKQMIAENQRKNGEFYVAPVYNYMLEEDKTRVGIYNIGCEAKGMYGLGTPSDLELFKNLPVFVKAISF